MKKNFTSKLDRAIAGGYNDLFRQMEYIQFSAKRISEKDFDTEREYEDLLESIVETIKAQKRQAFPLVAIISTLRTL